MMKVSYVFALASTLLLATPIFSQSVLNPNDAVVTYNPNSPPAQPPFGQIGKWVRTKRLSWNTDNYKAYIYKGCAFRLRFPKSYNPTVNDGKKYPMMVFFHGLGETGSIYDNEYQLYHGGDVFDAAVSSGKFDGYMLFMQSQGFWGAGQYQYITEIINYMVANNKLNPFQICDNGLSAGGQGTWEMLINHPTYIAAALPMSGVSIGYADTSIVNTVKFTPMWLFQGGLDGSPAPSTAQQVRDAVLSAGGNFKYTEYPDLGHGTWDRVWTEADFYPFMLRAYASNPWPLYGRTEFCPDEEINVILGLARGFNAYQWRKDGVVLNNETAHTLIVTEPGTYDARVLRNGIWSDWSRTPVVIKTKTPTVTPPITLSGLMSRAIPAPDGKTYVTLQVPDNGYINYTWKKKGSDDVIGTQRTLTVTQPGDYIVSVTEQFGCSSVFSPSFRVVNANGSNAPNAATNFTALAISNTQIELNWANNPSPVYNETAFEIYRSAASGGPYTFVGEVPADTLTFIDNNLQPNVKYFYQVRAINNNGAAALSSEASAITQSDKTPPAAPGNLRVVSTTTSSVNLAWDAATDNVGIDRYEVYVNGVKTYSTSQTTFFVGGLQSLQQYSFYVKAKDASGNYSPQSNQVSVATILQGLHYKYYEGSWSKLPDFNTLTPVKQGTSKNVDITVRNREDQFGFLWEGYIRIPVTGSYTFETYSDDGSALWIGPYKVTTTPLVNNDGLHSPAFKGGTITLQAGVYPISIAFFEQGGGQTMQVYWTSTAAFGNSVRRLIADQYFNDTYTPGGTAPAMPTAIKTTAIAYNKISLSWTDNATNESGFEIYRSTNKSGPYSIVAATGANVTTLIDSALSPSTTYYYKVQAINLYGSSGFDVLSVNGGIKYSYYEGTWLSMPNFASLTPVKTGYLTNISLAPANKTTGYAFKFEGVITVPTTGTYTLFTKSDDGSNLYIGGFSTNNLIVGNNHAFSTVEKSGTITLNKGTYPFYVTYFQYSSTATLTVSCQGPGIAKQVIPDQAFYNTQMYATTFALPAAPATPTGVVTAALSTSKIKLTWNDVATNETEYNLYRSIGDTTKFKLLTVLPANSNNYTDSSLFANVNYFYKIKVVGSGGAFNYSSIAFAKTKNNFPVITKLNNRSARYDTITTLSVSATDADGDALSFTAQNLPLFASFNYNGDKTATLSLTPAATDEGTYNNLRLIVNDGNGGADTTTFNLTVNDNYDPVIDSISDYTLNENEVVTIPLSAHDQNPSDALSWSVNGLPNAFTLSSGENGAAALLVKPTYASSGMYDVQVNVSDGNGGTTTRQFKLTVNDKDPNTSVYVRFMDQDAIGAPWNSVTGITSNNLIDASNNTTTIGLALQTSWWAAFHEGPQTDNNSGVYPDEVLKDYYYFGIFGGPETVDAKITGLDTARLYNLTFYAGSVWSGAADNGNTTYTVGTQIVSLNVQNNTQNTVSISNIKPAADSTITFTMAKGENTPVGYINALVITSFCDDSTAPVAPVSLTVQNTSRGVQLSWQDTAYNETGYQVYRSMNAAGPFNLIGSAMSVNVTGYVDTTIAGNTQYYYKVRAINSYGQSAYTDIASIITLNKVPKINPISNVILKNNQTVTVNVSATDDAADKIKLIASGLPTFATFVDNGNGTGVITIKPTAGTTGGYTVTVTAKDNSDSSSSASFDITVTDKDATSVYLNFSDGSQAGKPWNNLSGWPFANTVYSNIADDNNNATNIKVTLVNGFEGVVASGMRPGNGKSVYPEMVMRTALYEGSSRIDSIRISGLTAGKKYNFVFSNSHDDGLNGLTNFTINATTISLNATYNINKTVQINGITPDASGQVLIKVAKGAGADYAYISSLVIQSYDPSIFLSPTDLRVIDAKRNAISLQWADRSDSETGFEIWRAIDGSSSYSLLTTVAANTTSYTDANLTANKTYNYIVRAKKGATPVTYSSYSNAVSASTYAYSVYINFTLSNDAPAPWNNTDALPQAGYVWNNFLDETSQPTSIGMIQAGTFSGLYTAGMTTGNNSGIFPDKVIMDSYGLFPGPGTTIKITGLNLTMKYNFTFFASSQAYGDVNVAYTVGNKTSLLNASLNKSGTVTIYEIVPDNNGEAIITIAPATSTSQFGLIGALIIQGYIPSSNAAPQPPGSSQLGRFAAPDAQTKEKAEKNAKDIVKHTEIKAYPNPFDKYFNLSVPSGTNERVQVVVYDISGKLVYQNVFTAEKGNNNFRIEMQNATTAGMYVIKVLFQDSKICKSIPLMKQ